MSELHRHYKFIETRKLEGLSSRMLVMIKTLKSGSWVLQQKFQISWIIFFCITSILIDEYILTKQIIIYNKTTQRNNGLNISLLPAHDSFYMKQVSLFLHFTNKSSSSYYYPYKSNSPKNARLLYIQKQYLREHVNSPKMQKLCVYKNKIEPSRM